MSFTKTHTLTQEEKFILEAIEEANVDEIPWTSILGRAREAMQLDNFHLVLTEELILTCLGQLIERGLVYRVEHEPGKFCYRRA